MFHEVGKPDFPAMEARLLDAWRAERAFEASVEARAGARDFVFYDGPPFATGLPHYGHLLAGTIKDVVPRYQTMRGRRVERVFGWDCHGLPVEYEMEKELGLSGKREIETYGVAKFNEACRSIVLRHTREWEAIVGRMGRWVDFRNGYRTMDRDYMESIWWVFKQLWDKGLVYEGRKILPYCPRCATPLSNFEANQGYAEVEDPAITVRFRVRGADNAWLLAWTTTPWTLPSNLALSVGPGIAYVEVEDGGQRLILAESRLSAYYKPGAEPNVLRRMPGSALHGLEYEPLFPYFAHLRDKGAFRVVAAAFVSAEDGTGVVHTAPGFGEDDAEAARLHGLPDACPVDEECRFTSEVPDYAGRPVKECDKDIIRRLKESGALVHRGSIRHNYPHCWRDDSPLVYRAVSTWFVSIEPIKQAMLRANDAIRWVPDHIKRGRFGKWLENARDWAVSRNRYWGCPLPVWICRETGETRCVGSVAELEALTGRRIGDIHKHFVDDLEVPSARGGPPLRRVPEVLDCWFESGAMPYAQRHYPFERKEWFEANFPADFIAEGLDQTRGWFYTLVVLGAALFDKPAFRNVVVNGLVLAEDGQKMSKRKRNYPDPSHILDTYGADALRLFLLGSPVVRGEDLRFSEAGVRDVLKDVMLPVWNAYTFLATYARVDGWEPPPGPEAPPERPANILDRWILSSLKQMSDEIRASMDDYLLQKAANRFSRFIDDLTNWYIRRSRRRFWKSQNDADKAQAYQTLHFALMTFAKVAAPFIPFVTDEIYRNLRPEGSPPSVHLCEYPDLPHSLRDEPLERQMQCAMAAASLGRFLRARNEIKVRQPLARAMVVAGSPETRRMLAETAWIIKDELNVKELEVGADESALVSFSAKPNYRSLGPKLGPRMREAVEAVASLSPADIAAIAAGATRERPLSGGGTLSIAKEDLAITRTEREGLAVANEGEISLALDTRLDDALRGEGNAREFVSKIQNLRREMGLDVADRIAVRVEAPAAMAAALMAHADYIQSETLASSFSTGAGAGQRAELDVNGVMCAAWVERAAV